MMKLPGTLAFAILVWCGCGLAQSLEGVRVFEQTCTTCHGKAQVPPIPDPTALRQMTPAAQNASALTMPTFYARRDYQVTPPTQFQVADIKIGRASLKARSAFM